MDELELLKQREKDMRKLKSLATEIWQLNQKLLDLESNGLFDTESFLDIEIKKEELLKEEDRIYSSIKNNYDELLSLFDYFKNLVGNESLETEINLITYNNEDELTNLRIFKRLGLYITEGNINIEGLDEILPKLQYILKLNNFNDDIDEDIINTILVILNKYIKDNKYSRIKEMLLTLKYNIEFIYYNISQILIRNSYEIPDELYWKSIYESEMLKISDSDLDYYYEDKVKDILIRNIDYLTDQFYLNLEDDYEFGKCTLAEIFIRSMILFIKEDTLDTLRERFTDMSEISKYLFDDVSGEELVYNALSHYREDLELPRVIRLERTR